MVDASNDDWKVDRVDKVAYPKVDKADARVLIVEGLVTAVLIAASSVCVLT